jgi:glucose/mannose-6-phosphate isomerase
MKDLVAAFPQHLQHALEIGRSSGLSLNSSLRNIVICGLGGSGIGGRILSELITDCCECPVVLNNDYGLPTFAGPETLIIISSYSGNTEETVSSMEEALERGCQVCCVTSGGQVMRLAQQNNIATIVIPGGFPPRAMLGYSLISLLFIAKELGLAPSNFERQVELASQMLNSTQATIKAHASELASKLSDKLPVLYCSAKREGLAIRWRQQMNENAKTLCWHHVFPEMNHNELVGWEGALPNVSVILLEDEDDNERVKARMDICEKIFKRTNPVTRIASLGENAIERALYTIHFGDWLSVFLAEKAGVDAMSIDNIDLLKNTLADL